MRAWALALLFCCLTGAHADAAAISSVTQYAHSVHGLRQALNQLSASSSPSTGEVRRIQHQLRALRAVRLPNGRVMQTAMPLLASQLAPDLPSRRAVAAEVDALDTGLQVLPHRPPNAGDLSALDVVLRDPRFHPSCTPLVCLRDRIVEFLHSLDPNLGVPVPELPPVSSWIIAGLFLLLVATLAVLTFRGAVARTVVNVLSAPPSAAARVAASTAQAEELAAAGDYRGALHSLFLATLLALHEQHGIDLRPGLTNRELLLIATQADRALLSTPTQRDAMAELVDEFDRAWYGHLPFDAAGYDRCTRLARQVLGREERDAA